MRNNAIRLLTFMLVICLSSCIEHNYVKHLSDIKWGTYKVPVHKGKLMTDGIYCVDGELSASSWCWKFYDDGSCLLFYVRDFVSEDGIVDFEKTYSESDYNALNWPGLYSVNGNKLEINLYSDRLSRSMETVGYNKWSMSKISMDISSSLHLSIHNGNSNPINLEFVPCENIIEVERVKELKRTKWLWNSKHKATAYMDVIG